MNIKFRNFTNTPGFSKDYHLVCKFLFRINSDKVITEGFLWGRWEWAFSLPYLDETNISKIGIWEDNDTIVGLATYEDKLGSAYFCIDPNYQYLKKEMLLYANDNLSNYGKLRILIPNADHEFQVIASQNGFIPTTECESTAIFDLNINSTHYDLPYGYTIKNLADGYDIHKYQRVLWRGFNHEGGPPQIEKEITESKKSLVGGPHVNLKLKIAAISPQGDYVSYCGMWYEQGTNYALVEHVATDPDHRLKGLGRAVVLEGIKQCGILGAKNAYVGSSQQFYYNIGFYPLSLSNWWKRKNIN